MKRAAWGLIALVGIPTPALSQPLKSLPADYVAIVEAYAAGDRAEALVRLASWTGDRESDEARALKDVVVALRRCAGCPEKSAFGRLPLKAALLLHGEREVQQQFDPPVSEQVARCGTGTHGEIVEHLAAILSLIDPMAEEFLRPFYLGMAQHAQWAHCFAESREWAERGLRRFPRDGRLLLAEGVSYETEAFFTLAPAPVKDDLPSALLRRRDALLFHLKETREKALRAFEAARRSLPEEGEPRLRAGRVAFWLGRTEAARGLFVDLVQGAFDPSSQYLARLFLGRIEEDAGRPGDAEAHYREALRLRPESQTAAIALSHLLLSRGEKPEARQVLLEGLSAVRFRKTFDPWVTYAITQTPEGAATFDRLREGIRP